MSWHRHLDVVDAALLAARAGDSRVVVVTGAPGTGRSTLLAEAEATARRLGLTVASARALPGERDVRFAVAGRLFDVLPGLADRLPPAGTEPDLVGLSRLCSALCALARHAPLALLVDDVQWADPTSETLLRFLLRRLHHAPLALVVTTTGPWPATAGDPAADPAAADDLAGDATHPVEGDSLVRLGPLPPDEIRAVCWKTWGRTPDTEFVTGALAASGGNPRVLTGALTAYAASGQSPTGPPGARFAALVAEQRDTQVTDVLCTLSADAVDVLRLVAAGAGEVDLGLLTAHAGGPARPGDQVTELRAQGLVPPDDPVRPADEVVRARALAGMPQSARRTLHSAVAELAHRVAAPDEMVVRHLLDAHCPTAVWEVHALRRAALTALTAGRDERAAELAECALTGPLTAAQRAELLLAKAAATVVDRPAVSDRALALAVTTGGVGQHAQRLRAADLLVVRGDATVAIRAITRRIDALDPDDTLERDMLAALGSMAEGSQHTSPGTRVLREPVRDGEPADPATAALVAHRLALGGTDLGRARALARAALRHEEPHLFMPGALACTALVLAEEIEEAEAGFSTLLLAARRSRLRAATAWVLLVHASLALHCGRLDEAAADVEEANAALPPRAWHPLRRPIAVAATAMVELRRGAPAAAARTIASLSPEAAEPGFSWTYLLYARGALALDTGDPASAERDLRECGRRLTGRNWHNPAPLRWRPLLAQALLDLGRDPEQATALLTEERALAARWGTAGALGAADLATGLLLDESCGVDPAALLVDAEYALRASPLRLLHAEALTALALHQAPGASRLALLRRAQRMADQLGSAPLAGRIEEHLRTAAPASPPARGYTRSSGTLSAAESRVVDLAMSGLSNPEIADELSVIRRTVELHLSRAYRKLGVSSRAQLPGAVMAGS